mgnify:CR=1 FL=1
MRGGRGCRGGSVGGGLRARWGEWGGELDVSGVLGGWTEAGIAALLACKGGKARDVRPIPSSLQVNSAFVRTSTG